MKKILILAFILPILISCNKDNKETNSSELIGEWFRSEPVKVWVGHDEPIEERGERHFVVSFLEDGTFIYNRTTLGVYENTTIRDTSAYKIQHGTYALEGNLIDINLEKYIWFDSFHEDMTEPETITYNTSTIKFWFRDASIEIDEPVLIFTHHTLTDILHSEQEIPGIDKHVEEYIRLK